MMKRKIPILTPYSAQPGSLERNCTEKQMKKSQASERNHTLTSLIFHLLLLCAVMTTGCASEQAKYDFKDSKDAIGACHDYIHALQDLQSCSAGQLTDFIRQWQELSDTVYRYICKDSAFYAHTGLSMDFQTATDSVKTELLRLAERHTWSMKDVALLKMNTSPYVKDKELQPAIDKAAAFYAGLDRLPEPSGGDAKGRIQEYVRFLVDTRKQGIHSHQQMLDFIGKEDACFRSFLAHMPEYTDFDMTGITKTTEAVCAEIFQSASSMSIPPEETLAYMSMRTNRRLLQNAKVSADLIRNQKVREARQANAYLWMSVQPFLSMDAVCVSMLTDRQRQQMTELAEGYPRLVNILSAKRMVDTKTASEIPCQLAKLYIATL